MTDPTPAPLDLEVIERALMLAPDDAPAALLNDLRDLVAEVRRLTAERDRLAGDLAVCQAELRARGPLNLIDE